MRILFLVLLLIIYPISSFAQAAEEAKEQNLPPNPIAVQIESIAKSIKGRYNLGIYFKSTPKAVSPRVHFKNSDPEDYPKLLAYIKLFEEEINKYPKSFFKNTHLKGILFIKNLFDNKKPAEGVYVHGKNVLLMDFDRADKNPKRQRHTVHHEIYHVIEMQSIGFPGWADPEWAALNGSGFHYGNIRKKLSPVEKISKPPYPGFVTEYAMTSIEEDKAEVFACLMVKSQSKLLNVWASDDKVLQAKIRYMKNFLRTFCPQMDSAYWATLF